MDLKLKYALIFIGISLGVHFGTILILDMIFDSNIQLTLPIYFSIQLVSAVFSLGLIVLFVCLIKPYISGRFSMKLVIVSEFFSIVVIMIRFIYIIFSRRTSLFYAGNIAVFTLMGISLIFMIVTTIVLFVDQKEDRRIRVVYLIMMVLLVFIGNNLLNELANYFRWEFLYSGIFYILRSVFALAIIGLKGYIVYCANDQVNIVQTDESSSLISDQDTPSFEY